MPNVKPLLIALAAASLAALTNNAVASTYNLGTVNGTQSFANGVSLTGFGDPGLIHGPNFGLYGNFSDIVTFQLASSSDGAYGVHGFSIWLDSLKLSGINNFSVALFSAANPAVALVSGLNGSFDHLSSGNYYFDITGTGTGFLGGGYFGVLSVTPVPEPGEWALMLSGLGLLGYIARRRSGKA